MLSIIIIVLFLFAFYNGARRGLVMQVILTTGYVLTMLVAKAQAPQLANKIHLLIPYPNPSADSQIGFFKGISLFNLDKGFYTIFSYLVILFIGWLVTRFIGMLFNSLTFFPIIKQVNILGGGTLSLLVTYIVIFFVLVLLALIPMDVIQQSFHNSGLVKFMINDTPYFSKMIFEWLQELMK